MAIEFSCSCGQKFRVADEHAGRKTKCKACAAVVAVPARAVELRAGSRPAARPGHQASAPRKKPDDELFILEPSETDDNADDESQFDFAVEPSPPSRRLPRQAGDARKRKRAPANDDSSKPRQKKRSSDKGEEGLSKPVIAGLVLFGVIGLAGVGIGISKALSGAASAPAKPVEKQFMAFRHELGNFAIEHPSDWEVTSKGGTGGILPWASFQGDDATVRVRADQNGSSIGTIAQAGSNLGFSVPGIDQEEVPDELDPVAAVHDFQVNDVKGDFDSYTETPPETFQTKGFGEGRLSVFTASSGFSKIMGLRCTLLATDFQYNIVCKIPARQFPNFEPIFRRMVLSFQR